MESSFFHARAFPLVHDKFGAVDGFSDGPEHETTGKGVNT